MKKLTRGLRFLPVLISITLMGAAISRAEYCCEYLPADVDLYVEDASVWNYAEGWYDSYSGIYVRTSDVNGAPAWFNMDMNSAGGFILWSGAEWQLQNYLGGDSLFFCYWGNNSCCAEGFWQSGTNSPSYASSRWCYVRLGPDDVLARWTFDDGAGDTAADASGNGNIGTLINGPTWTNGIIGGALWLNGASNQYVVAQTATTVTGAFTVAAWVLPHETTSSEIITVVGAQYDNEFDLSLVYGHYLSCDIGNGGSWITNMNVDIGYRTGTWSHVACAVAPNGYTMYLNGEVVASGITNNVVPLLCDPVSYQLTIGRIWNGGEQSSVKIDDVLIYGRALTTNEIANLYYVDTIGDGIPNWWRAQYFGSGSTTNGTSCASCDPDSDGLTNLQEYQLATDPNNPDTDGDGLPDGVDFDPKQYDHTPPSFTVSYPSSGASIP